MARKKREDGYRRSESKDGSFSCNIRPAVNVILDFFCEKRNYNKTNYVNDIVMKQLQKDMQDTKVEISVQELFDIMNSTEESGSGENYKQIEFEVNM